MIIFGVVALVFGNHQRGFELMVSGVIFMAIKYLIGFIYLGIMGVSMKTAPVAVTSSRYDQLITTLNAVKHGKAPKHQRKTISEKLIENAKISPAEKQDLLSQLEEAYNAPDEN